MDKLSNQFNKIKIEEQEIKNIRPCLAFFDLILLQQLCSHYISYRISHSPSKKEGYSSFVICKKIP